MGEGAYDRLHAQRDLRRIEAANRQRRKEAPAITRIERRSESDDEVRGNIPPDLVALAREARDQGLAAHVADGGVPSSRRSPLSFVLTSAFVVTADAIVSTTGTLDTTAAAPISTNDPLVVMGASFVETSAAPVVIAAARGPHRSRSTALRAAFFATTPSLLAAARRSASTRAASLATRHSQSEGMRRLISASGTIAVLPFLRKTTPARRSVRRRKLVWTPASFARAPSE